MHRPISPQRVEHNCDPELTPELTPRQVCLVGCFISSKKYLDFCLGGRGSHVCVINSYLINFLE